jgi:hypothetical protein
MPTAGTIDRVEPHDATVESTLRRWIVDHEVCWELSPLTEITEHTKVQIGYELRLFARDAAGVRAGPGGPQSVGVYEMLRTIATSTLPREPRPTTCEIEPFDASWHLRPETRWSPEVQLVVRIIHQDGYFEPIDRCESRCAHEIEDGLRRLGAQERVWSDRTSGGHVGL